MANPDDIEIRIKTTGETAGAEEVKESLKKIDTEVKSLGETSAKADPQLSQIVNLGRAAAAVKIAESIGQISQAVRGMAGDLKSSDKDLSKTLENSATALDSVTGALSGAAQGFAAGGPLGAAVGATIGLFVGPLKNAYAGVVDSINGVAKAEAEGIELVKRMAELRRKYAEEQRNLGIRGVYDAETAAISKTTGEMEKLSRLQEAQRRADSAISTAVNGPATPEAKITNDRASALAEVRASVEEAQALATQAAKLASAAEANAERVSKAQGESSQAAVAAIAEKDSAKKRLEEEKSKANQVAQAAKIKEEEITAAALTATNALGNEASDVITKIGEDALKGMEDSAKEEGVKLSSAQKTAMAILSKLLTDTIPDAKQYQPIRQAMELFRTGLDSFHQAQFDSMTKWIADLSKANTEAARIDVQRNQMIEQINRNQAEAKQRLGDLQNQVNQINSRSDGGIRPF
jgi:hypothetical protein